MFADFISLIYPEPCYSCGEPLFKGEQYLCTHCLLNLPYSKSNSIEKNEITQKFSGKVDVKYGVSFLTFTKGGKSQKILHNLKYKDAQKLGFYLGREFGYSLKKTILLSEIDVIIPIPLHKTKLKKRGFNQAEVIANGISNSLGILVDISSLNRVVNTDTQTKKSRIDRWKNVKSIFTVDSYILIDKNVLLVDDVLTTGATIEAAASVLLSSGVKSVSVACLAVAQ